MPQKMTHEHLLYGLALTLALAVRFIWLDAAPLTDQEAGWALQALHLAGDRSALIGAQPGYVLATSQLFMFGLDSDFLARFWPALAGSLLAITPYFFRRLLGKEPALLLAFGLAVDPGLVALSRQAGGPMLAGAFLMLALGAGYAGRMVWAGIFAGLALLGGPTLWPGLLGLGLAGLIYRFVERRKADEEGAAEEAVPSLLAWPELRTAAAAAAGTLLVVGTLFFQVPRGIGAISASLAAYLAGWGGPEGMPAGIWLLTPVLYQPVAVIFGFWGGLRSLFSRSNMDRFLSIWLLAAFALGLFYPGRQPSDLAWVILPLWGLAAREILRHMSLDPELRYSTLGVMALTVVLQAFEALNLARLISNLAVGLPNQGYPQFWVSIAAGLTLLIFLVYLVAWGWSMRAAGRGFLWGNLVMLGIYTLGCTASAAGWRVPRTTELWQTSPLPQNVDLLTSSIADLSRWNTSQPNELDVVVAGLDSPALRWALRSDPRVESVAALPGGMRSAIVITPGDQQQPVLASAYRGQNVLLSLSPNWASFTVLDWLNWVIFRVSPGTQQKVILWARSDLFSGGGVPVSSQTIP
ncbi:MAG TPA: hypothetical protein VMT46_07140 [Anaerolineaceae bacterium]|nr:hypothetical protein [Anaerolineaceae bacterium]